MEGWKCPECGRINAPFIDHCPCKDKWTTVPFTPYPYYPYFPQYPYNKPWEIIVTCDGTKIQSTYTSKGTKLEL